MPIRLKSLCTVVNVAVWYSIDAATASYSAEMLVENDYDSPALLLLDSTMNACIIGTTNT